MKKKQFPTATSRAEAVAIKDDEKKYYHARTAKKVFAGLSLGLALTGAAELRSDNSTVREVGKAQMVVAGAEAARAVSEQRRQNRARQAAQAIVDAMRSAVTAHRTAEIVAAETLGFHSDLEGMQAQHTLVIQRPGSETTQE